MAKLRLSLNKNSIILIQIFWMIVLLGLALDFAGVNIGLDSKMASITLLFVTGFLATEIGIMSLIKHPPALVANNVGQYVVAIIFILMAIIALTGFVGAGVPAFLAPYAALIIGLGAVIDILLAITK